MFVALVNVYKSATPESIAQPGRHERNLESMSEWDDLSFLIRPLLFRSGRETPTRHTWKGHTAIHRPRFTDSDAIYVMELCLVLEHASPSYTQCFESSHA